MKQYSVTLIDKSNGQETVTTKQASNGDYMKLIGLRFAGYSIEFKPGETVLESPDKNLKIILKTTVSNQEVTNLIASL